jgi:hypothetical protein
MLLNADDTVILDESPNNNELQKKKQNNIKCNV